MPQLPIKKNNWPCYTNLGMVMVMGMGMSVGCGYMCKCRSHLILVSKIRGHAKIFIFLSIFLLFSSVECLQGVLTYFMHNLIVLVYFFGELELLNTLPE